MTRFLGCALVSMVALSCFAENLSAAELHEEKATLKSGNKDIRIERIEPKGKGPFPAVVMLNGSNGVEVHYKAYREYAVRFAESGFVAIILYYFDRTETTYADRPTIEKNYLAWMLTIEDGLKYTRGLPHVDTKRIGMMGFSLGSFLALSMAAARGYDHIAAVVEYAGGYPTDNPIHKLNNLKKMPPVLILHGENDDIVPVKEAQSLESLLKDNKINYEIKLYANQKHVFTGDDAQDALERTCKFFTKYLQTSTSEKK